LVFARDIPIFFFAFFAPFAVKSSIPNLALVAAAALEPS
jgi:hypothetical protein